MIRSGIYDDVPRIVDMAERFWTNTIYTEPMCRDTVEAVARGCIDNNMMSVLSVDGLPVGFACGVVGALLGNASVLTGTELAWWVEPEHRSGRNGISLLRHLEGLAKKAGVKYWNMLYMQSSMPDEIKGIYERMGYERNETLYTRVL